MVSVVMLVVFQRFVFQVGGRKLLKSKQIVNILSVISAALIIGNLFGHFISYVDEAGFHHRGPGYFLWLICTGLIGVIIIANICMQHISVAEKIAFIQYLILPYIGNALYSFLHFPFIQYQCVLISLLFIHVKVFVNRTYSLAEQTEINMKQQMQLMTSQIQPHFIFNALSSIRQISKDKETADLILDFSNYLRMNLETLSYDACVPFEKELEHTKQYLRIEQLRFGERLAVSYDLQCMDFEIPPLTLQPIVENAIKHGILERINGGTVRITSVREENHIVITVADDGVGFDPEHKKEDGRVHIGIENVRARLERMVGGSLVIDSEVGKGTTIQILIPCTYGKV